MFLETDGIVIKTSKSTNNDIFLTLFTKKAGKIEVVANGAKSSKSPLAACSKPYVFGQFFINTSSKTMRLNSCTIYESNFRITESLEKLAYGSYILELCRHSTHKNIVDLEHYSLIVEIASLLSKRELDYKLMQLTYLIKLSRITGHMPSLLKKCISCGLEVDEPLFSVIEGGLIHPECITSSTKYYRLNDKFLQIIEYLSVKDVRVIVNTKIHYMYIEKLLPIFEEYICHHLDISDIKSKSFIATLIE